MPNSTQPPKAKTTALVRSGRNRPNHRLQAFFAQQVDTPQNGVHPQKRYADVNIDATLGALRYGGEAVYLGGQGATAPGKCADLNSFALRLRGTSILGMVDLGLTAGRGGGNVDPSDNVNNDFQSLFLDETSFAFNHLFGVADLRGKSLRERADALIAIAHPDHRAALRTQRQG